MKAAILKRLGTEPIYGDFKEPFSQDDEQVVIKVKAAALKNLDKLKTYKEYYSPYNILPVVVGTDCVGTLPNGSLVYAHGLTGTMAEKALIHAKRYTLLPDNIDPVVAAALPNAILGSVVPLKMRAKMKPGQNILINGATGITGKVAVQVAKHFGATKIIATGRNEDTLQSLKSMGVEYTISLNQNEVSIIDSLKEIDDAAPIDIVLDYLWGKPAELIIHSFQNKSSRNISFVTVGDMAGNNINLASGSLRSVDLTLIGSGFGSLTPEVLKKLSTEFLPEMFALAADKKLLIETEEYNLKDISTAWNYIAKEKRVVISID